MNKSFSCYNSVMSRLSERVENFNRAFNMFDEVRNDFLKDKSNNTFRLALTQGFEIVFELGWKVLKDYLFINGVSVQLPRDVIKEAFNKEVISNGQIWIDMIDARNATSHEYNMDKVDLILENISSTYYNELYSFKNWLGELDE